MALAWIDSVSLPPAQETVSAIAEALAEELESRIGPSLRRQHIVDAPERAAAAGDVHIWAIPVEPLQVRIAID